MGGELGACHGLDVPLVFGNLDRGQPAVLIGEGPARRRRRCPRGCARRGRRSPTHGDPGWPAYDTGQRLTQLFDTRPVVTAYPEEASRLLWQDHTFAVAAARRPVAQPARTAGLPVTARRPAGIHP